jgi:hypothetical protein
VRSTAEIVEIGAGQVDYGDNITDVVAHGLRPPGRAGWLAVRKHPACNVDFFGESGILEASESIKGRQPVEIGTIPPAIKL